jgi:hypothetical protein
MTKAEDRELRQAWTRFDRLTAFGCAQRGNTFDPEKCAAAKAEFEGIMQRIFP